MGWRLEFQKSDLAIGLRRVRLAGGFVLEREAIERRMQPECVEPGDTLLADLGVPILC